MRKICNKCRNEFEYSNSHFKNICNNCIKKMQSKGGKRCHELHPNHNKKVDKTNKRNGIGIYGQSKEKRIENGKKGSKTTNKLYKEEKKKWGKKGAKKAKETNKINKTSVWDSRIQSMGGKAVSFETHSKAGKIGGTKGGLKAAITNRKNKPHWFLNIPFDSQGEDEIARDLYYQKILKLKDSVNCHVQMKGGEVDFLIHKYKCCIEYHEFSKKGFDRYKVSYKQYYKQRKKILDKNNYKDYNLLVINSK